MEFFELRLTLSMISPQRTRVERSTADLVFLPPVPFPSWPDSPKMETGKLEGDVTNTEFCRSRFWLPRPPWQSRGERFVVVVPWKLRVEGTPKPPMEMDMDRDPPPPFISSGSVVQVVVVVVTPW